MKFASQLVMAVGATNVSLETRRKYVHVGSTLAPASDGLKRDVRRTYLRAIFLCSGFDGLAIGATESKVQRLGGFFGNVAGRSQRRDYMDVFTSFPKKVSQPLRLTIGAVA